MRPSSNFGQMSRMLVTAFGREVEPSGRTCLAEALAALRCAIVEERELNPTERRAVDALGVAGLPASLLSAAQTLDRVWTRILSEQGTRTVPST